MTLERALLSGLPIGVGQTAVCDVCGQTLRPNDTVEILVLLAGATVEVVVTRCASCARGQIRPGTSRPCWLARGTLAATVDGAGHSRVVLSGASVIDRNE